eukprot:TRINITY_DN15834_c0_g2_i1.p1 TRINITY_DN15834_c0_g2~~TRINITY_DN15834_c0_g2_i1.p1  ORF type:complete len:386 (-),score=62.08 TRINITY_DN15834_c0_g2_i1:200-1357(-)
MPSCRAGIEFSNVRVSDDDCFESIGKASVLLVDSQQKRSLCFPIPVTLSCVGDRVVLDGAGGDRLEVFLTPLSVVQRRHAASQDGMGTWRVDVAGTGGMTWSFRVEIDNEDEAAFVEARLRDAQQRVVGSLHTAVGGPARYPSLEPLLPSKTESSKGRYILGGYVVVGHCKRMNHPLMMHASAELQPTRFRLLWGELRVSITNRDVDLKCFFYQGHEHVSESGLVCMTTFSPDDDMEIQGNVLILRGAEPRCGVRDASEVPGDDYLSFRSEPEARLWNEMAGRCFEQHRVARAALDVAFAEIAARQSAPTFPREPLLARAKGRGVTEREAATQPTDSIALAMQKVDADNEEIARICQRQRDVHATVSGANMDFSDAKGTVILARN